MATDPTQAIERIRKLMALTEGRGASENEATIAASMVQRLLAEHNLSMAAVEASGGATQAGGKREKSQAAYRQVYKWQRRLMASVADVNYCACFEREEWVDGKGSQERKPVFDGYDLIGRVDNVTTVKVMFEYLVEAIERLARDAVGNDPTQYFTRPAHSFKEGCADRLTERLTEQKRDLVEAQEREAKDRQAAARHPGAAPGTAVAILLRDLVQDEKDLNEDVRRGVEPGTTARERFERDQESRRVIAEREARLAALIAQGIDKRVAWYMSVGYDRERAEQLAAPQASKPETETQKRKRTEQEERADRRYYESQQSRARREARRLDPAAYQMGKDAGERVSLNRQIDEDRKRRLT